MAVLLEVWAEARKLLATLKVTPNFIGTGENMSEIEKDRDSYKGLAAKYLKERDYFEELHRTARIEADGYWGCLQNKQEEIEGLIKQRDGLVEACEGALKAMNEPAVQATGDWQTGMFCGLEDRNITDRYDACMYGHEQALEKVQEWVLCGFEAALIAAGVEK